MKNASTSTDCYVLPETVRSQSNPLQIKSTRFSVKAVQPDLNQHNTCQPKNRRTSLQKLRTQATEADKRIVKLQSNETDNQHLVELRTEEQVLKNLEHTPLKQTTELSNSKQTANTIFKTQNSTLYFFVLYPRQTDDKYNKINTK